MKTWEMIKELTDNPKKKFVSDKGHKDNEMIAERLQQNIVFKYTNKHTNVDCIATTREWEEVEEPEEPVTFMEIGKSRDIRVEHDLILECDQSTFRNTREMLQFLVKTFANTGLVEILTEGKFYIKEDN